MEEGEGEEGEGVVVLGLVVVAVGKERALFDPSCCQVGRLGLEEDEGVHLKKGI